VNYCVFVVYLIVGLSGTDDQWHEIDQEVCVVTSSFTVSVDDSCLNW
jgi:hypothetical protein